MTPRPARCGHRAGNVRPAHVTDTDFRCSSMGQMHRDHAWRQARRAQPGQALSSEARPGLDPEWEPLRIAIRFSQIAQTWLRQETRQTRSIAGVVGVGGLALDDLLGELDQHPPGIVVRQLAKHPQQPQFEQGLHCLRTSVPQDSIFPGRAPVPGTDRGKCRARRLPVSVGRYRDGPTRCRFSAAGPELRAPPRDRSGKARARAIWLLPADRFCRRSNCSLLRSDDLGP